MTTTANTKKTTKDKTTPSKTVSVTKESVVNLPKNPFIFEVLDVVSKQRSNTKKVEILKNYADPSLKAVLIWNFDESIISLLPPGEVPYSSYDEQNTFSGTLSTKLTEEIRKMYETGSFSVGNADTNGRTTIRREYKHFYHFLKGGNPGLNQIRREMMFINILQGLHPLEAEVITLIKDKRLGEKYKITKENVSEAFPDIKWGNRS